ncbi:MAG: N-acetyltransferase family protein [Burkholderiales bacterium]
MSDARQFELRTAVAGDVAALAAIYGDHVLHGTASFELEPPGEAEMARRFDDITSKGYPYFVAASDGKVIAFAYAGPFRARPAYRYSVEDSIYVDARWHRCGVGRALLDRLISVCTEQGCRQMIAVIGDGANTSSIGLHERAGFVRAGLLASSGFKFGRWVDTVLMQRALGDGDATPP